MRLSQILISSIVFCCMAMAAKAEVVSTETLSVDSGVVCSEVEESREVLMSARQKLNEAERLATEIVEAARLESIHIRKHAKQSAGIHEVASRSLADVQEEVVAVEARNQSLKEILIELMPQGWRVMIDVDVAILESQRIDFITEKTRDLAIADLTSSLGLEYRYFHYLKDAHGNATPLLVVTD